MMHTRLRPVAVLGVALMCAFVLVDVAGAAPGDLDGSFGFGGTVTTDFGGDGPALPSSVAVQADGKIVAAGFAALNQASPLDEFALARYESNGALDQTFGSAGRVMTDFGGRDDHIEGIALQPDGKIVAAGVGGLEDGTGAVELARYTRDGQLDPSFGSDGRVLTDLGAGTLVGAEAIAIQANGRIVIAGTANIGTSVDCVVARYLSSGRLDASFGHGGVVLTDFDDGSRDIANAVALSGKRIIVAGYTTPAYGVASDFALAAYTSNGRLDQHFGSGGKVRTDVSQGDDDAESVVVANDARIIAAGSTRAFGGQRDSALARYESDGSLDGSFGSDGLSVADLSGNGSDDGIRGVSLQPDGKIVTGITGGPDFGVARYDAFGYLDASFGSGGVTHATFSGGSSYSTNVALQADGKIVAVGGPEGSFGSLDFALARFLGG